MNFETILSSALISVLLSTITSYLVSLQLRRVDFRNEYFKKIIDKRLAAYEFIETQIAVLKLTGLDDTDDKAYPLCMGNGEDKFLECQQNLALAIAKGVWIDENTSLALDKMNELFYKVNKDVFGRTEDEICEIGKLHYEEIKECRIALERAAQRGFLQMHKMNGVFKPKKRYKRSFKFD